MLRKCATVITMKKSYSRWAIDPVLTGPHVWKSCECLVYSFQRIKRKY